MEQEWRCAVCGCPRPLAEEGRRLLGLAPLPPGAKTCRQECARVLAEKAIDDAQELVTVVEQQLRAELAGHDGPEHEDAGGPPT